MKSPAKRSWIPFVFAGFMGIVMAANAALTFFAINSWPGMETEKPYEKGLAYNQELAAAKAQANLRWEVDFTFAPAKEESRHPGARRGEIKTVFRGPDGQALSGLTVKASMARPIGKDFDLAVELSDQGDGGYAAMADFPLPGRWLVRIQASLGNDSYRMRREIMVP